MSKSDLTRRQFAKWCAFLAQAGPALLQPARASAAAKGEWVPVACWNHCGGHCPNFAYVVDGTVQRLKSDDTQADSPDCPQQRRCARGAAQRFQVFGADRLKYPMKRRNWKPGGGKRELRGRDEWVRISWEEALDSVAAELRRIKETYGNESMFIASGGEIRRTLGLYGGYVQSWGSVSFGAWPDVYRAVTGIPGSPWETGNDRMRFRKAKLVVMWGANPAWSSGGNATYNYLQAKRQGTKFIFVDPQYNDSAQALADEWIPVRPGTDSALLLGMAHHIITNDLCDQEFLDRYCVGFDREHMPPDADPAENFKDYVLGAGDGKPKTPEWASAICGTAPEVIRRFAAEYATTKPALIQTTGAPARINRGEQFPHAILTLAFMTGNVGVPGSGVGPNFHLKAGNAGPSLVEPGSPGVKSGPGNPLRVRVNNCELWDAILTGKYTDGPGPKKDIDIRLIYYEKGAALNQKTGAVKGIEAHRKVDFVVTQNYVFNPNTRHSDIVLPVTTPWEKYGHVMAGNRETIMWSRQVTEPLFEAKDDLWIAREIGRRLGIDAKAIDPLPIEQRIFNQISGARVIMEDGRNFEPLVTITAEDIEEMGVQGKPQKGRIPLSEFREKGVYQVPRSPGDKLGFTALEEFRSDPETNPLDTSSGRLEIHCQALADRVKNVGFNEKDPLPKYEPIPDGYECTLSAENKSAEYPLQLIEDHYPRSGNSTFDNVPHLRHAFPRGLTMNSRDAAARGLKTGDIVLIRSQYGKVIRPVQVTGRIIPGAVSLGEGAWMSIDEETGIDRAGCVSLLNGAIPSGQGHTGFNTCLVEVEKYGKLLRPDWKWPANTPAFKEDRHA